jgi:hypothetical protein
MSALTTAETSDGDGLDPWGPQELGETEGSGSKECLPELRTFPGVRRAFARQGY